MKNLFYYLFSLLTLCIVVSCSNYDDTNIKTEYNNDLSAVKIDNGIVILPSIFYLKQILNDYKKGVKEQNNFNDKIKELQNQGFKPLTPCFDGLNAKQTEEFVLRKKDRIIKRNVDFGLLSRVDIRDYELDLDDEIVSDPFLAALLNENREIIIADVFYKYTELGLFYIQKNDKNFIANYLDSMTPEEKFNLLLLYKNEFSTTNKPQEKYENLENGITLFRMLNVAHLDPSNNGDGESDGSSSGNDNGNIGGLGTVVTPGSSTSTGLNLGDGVFNPNSFGSCSVASSGFFEGIFGESESCYEYYNDNRRVKVNFWNQNFFIFSSLGSKTKLQKREHLNVIIGTISWWEKSYATQIRLGVNNLTFKYNFNVPMFNQDQFNYSTTFFEYNGTKYNVYGEVIPTVPTSAGKFNFAVNNANNVVDITFAGANIQLDNGQINQAIDLALDQFISQIQSFDRKQELLAKKSLGILEVRAVYAKPFANSVQFIIAKQNWMANNENSIVHYFDFNFLITYNSSFSGVEDYLAGMNGATSYDNVNGDIYGAALHNNFWKGRRLHIDENN